MVVDDVVGVGFFFGARERVDGGPLRAVLGEFGDDLAAEDAWGLLEEVGEDRVGRLTSGAGDYR